MSEAPTLADLPSLIATGQKMVAERMAAAPDFEIFDSIKNQLDFIRTTVETGRRPTNDEKERLTIGVYAAREFETNDPDFANVLFDIAYLFKRL